MSQMFSFAETVYAAWFKEKAGNISQFLPCCGVRSFLFLHLGQCSAPDTRTPKGLRLLVKIMIKCK